MEGIANPAPSSVEIPAPELKKFRSVLRLGTGDEIALLPGDGRVLRCRINGLEAVVEDTLLPETDAKRQVTLALALSRPDTLETCVRMATEMGVASIQLFPSARSVVRWDQAKLDAKLSRLKSIAREAAEVCFRTKLPELRVSKDFATLLKELPDARVLSEGETVTNELEPSDAPMALVIGPEGGWAPQEVALIGDRAVTLGPRVLRVDTAAAAACALALFGPKVS